MSDTVIAAAILDDSLLYHAIRGGIYQMRDRLNSGATVNPTANISVPG